MPEADVLEGEVFKETGESKTIELHQLDLLKGNGKTVKIISTVASRWEKVALRLYFSHNDIARIERHHHDQSVLACQTMFTEWLDGKDRTREPITWATLIEVLIEAEFSELASDLQAVLGM